MPGHPLCPVTALLNYMKLSRNAPLEGPAFVVPRGKSFVPYTPTTFVAVLRGLLTRMGNALSHTRLIAFAGEVPRGHFHAV